MNYKYIIKFEKNNYFANKNEYLKNRLLHSETYLIWKYQKKLRKCEHLHNIKWLKLLYYWELRKKHILGHKLGIDIPIGVFGKGLRIYHAGNIVVNPNAHIDDNCIIVGNVCIGNVNGQNAAPIIGKNCMLGWGSTVIGNIKIADDCSIGACALVIKNVEKNNSIMVGVPAKNINTDGM